MAKVKDIFLSRPVHELLGIALSVLENKTSTIAETYGETVEIGNAHHENGPEEFWRVELGRALEKLEGLKETHKYATVYDPSTDESVVGLGSGVNVIETYSPKENESAKYTVVSPADILVCARLWITHPQSWLSTETTRGENLMSKRVGTKDLRVAIPNGEIRVEITGIEPGDFKLSLPTRLSGATKAA